MNIIVCIKQVPGTSNVKVDPVTGVLIRDGIESKMNLYDLFALEMGLDLKERCGGTLRVITMGPPAAKEVLTEALCMGADSGVLISDRRLGGADVLATAYTVSEAIEAMKNYDIILCGKQTTDGDTAQVGPETAEFLKIPHATNVQSIEQLQIGKIRFVSTMDNRVITATLKTPCLLCADAEINTPRLPSYIRKKDVQNKNELIKTITVDDFCDTDAKHYGLSGSATKVERIFPPEKNRDKKVLKGDSDTLSNGMLDILKTGKFI